MAGLRLVPKRKVPGFISFDVPTNRASGEEVQTWSIVTKKGTKISGICDVNTLGALIVVLEKESS